jgi:hypothetical protein
MANTSAMRQSKLRKVVLEPELTPGTYVVPDANTPVCPVVTFPMPAMDRGKGMIDRTSTMDGYAGDVASVRGSSAWSMSLEVPLNDVTPVVGAGAPWNYWTTLLGACGFLGEWLTDEPVPGVDTLRLYPTTRAFTGFNVSTEDQDPMTLSVTTLQNNNELADTAVRLRGVTGVATFDLAVGDIPKLSVAGKGMVVTQLNEDNDFLDNSDINVSAFGTTTNWGNPFVCKAMTIGLVDPASNPVDVCLQSLTINMNSNNPDFECPSEEYGFEISPVFHDTSPTVDFTFPDSLEVQDWVFAAFRSGDTFSLEATLNTPTGRTITFVFPKLQFQSVALADSGGFVQYTVTAKVVRDPGSYLPADFFHINYVVNYAP